MIKFDFCCRSTTFFKLYLYITGPQALKEHDLDQGEDECQILCNVKLHCELNVELITASHVAACSHFSLRLRLTRTAPTQQLRRLRC